MLMIFDSGFLFFSFLLPLVFLLSFVFFRSPRVRSSTNEGIEKKKSKGKGNAKRKAKR